MLILIAGVGVAVSLVLYRIGRSGDHREGLGAIRMILGLLKKHPEADSEQRRSFRLQRMALLGLVGAAGLAFVTVAFSATAAPEFCNVCHPMKADVEAWQKSSHANVTCFACHLKPGLGNFVQGHVVDAVKSGLAWVTGNYHTPINVESKLSEHLSSDGCKTCHTLKNVVPSPGVLINHGAHTERGIGCATCHNRVGHVDMKGGYVSAVSMEGCTRCHGFAKEDTAPGKCELCHTKGFDLIPTDHDAADWTTNKHSIQAKEAVAKVKGGGKEAGEKEVASAEEGAAGEGHEGTPPLPLHNGKASCDQCHDREKFCFGCHKTEIPHPANYKNSTVHGKEGTEKPQVCANCHAREAGTQNFCTACHHKGFDPNVAWVNAKGATQKHPQVAKAGGAEGCFRCHDERYCSSCHINGTPNTQYMYRQR
ncbi:MAG: cytochrome c3 family protein [Candidatus Aquicultorales bacterium]